MQTDHGECNVMLGKQTAGSSSEPIYRAAEALLDQVKVQSNDRHALDLGGGQGIFSEVLLKYEWNATLLDYAPGRVRGVKCVSADLNERWPLVAEEFILVVALEVVEHLENPRHFFRELARVLRPNGYALVSTPNQLSIASKLCLLARNEFRDFQQSCYPSHITALLDIDFRRISNEVGLELLETRYTNWGRIPFLKWRWQIVPGLKGRSFSDNVIYLFQAGKKFSP